MLEYAEKLTRTPAAMTEQDIEVLRGHGLKDQDVLGVVMVAAFFNVATRVADALGVELDAELTRGTPEYARVFGPK